MASGADHTDPMAEIRAGFFEECDELLEELADGLTALRTGTATDDSFNAVFRAVHSIKGGAAAFGLSDLTDFAHGLEARLVAYRDAGATPSGTEVPPLERAADRLAELVGFASRGESVSEERRLADAELLNDDLAIRESATAPSWRLSADRTNDPRKLLLSLAELGDVSTRFDRTSLPAIEQYDPERPTLAWNVAIASDLPPQKLAQALKALDPEEAMEALSRHPATALTDTADQIRSVDTAAATSPTIRVDLDRIDRLINLVGELVINQAMLARSAEDLGAQSNSDHMVGLDELVRLTRELQDSVMQIRAQPVKPLFHRMARICREAASMEGKDVEFVSDGQDTEIDKTVIERLSDPLTHMIRNAVSHGLEDPKARHAAGKAPTGKITLRASHRSGQVILELEDDGAGINRGKVLQRARANGIIAPDATPSPSEIDDLLFRPGFSTADEVSELSGRGVGMDVVRAAIHGLGGRIFIDSTPGRGTRFEVALPLTLAVLDAMVVSIAEETLVLPLSTIHETLTIEAGNVLELVPGKHMLRYDGRAIALLDLGEELDYYERRESFDDCVALIIVADGQPPYALAIEEIHEQRQVVIKGLQEGFAAASAVAGATILGDGRIALIIDPLDASLSPDSRGAARQASIPVDLSA